MLHFIPFAVSEFPALYIIAYYLPSFVYGVPSVVGFLCCWTVKIVLAVDSHSEFLIFSVLRDGKAREGEMPEVNKLVVHPNDLSRRELLLA